MLEPVQNCFTFYHPDGISSAHVYSDQDELKACLETKPESNSIIAQQNLALTPPTTPKDS